MKTMKIQLLCAATAALSLTTASADIGYEFVTVGDPGNANDTTGYGGVSYSYSIGKYEVTVNQYILFLNAVAATDNYGLFDRLMPTGQNAEIAQSGSSGNYAYSVIGDGNRPVTLVSWFDAARFCNWMSNGQGSGGTETGAYTLNGATSGIITNNGSGSYWIPSEDEWYKAAYYDPSLSNGAGGYWLYPTRSNSAPDNAWDHRTSPNGANYWNAGGTMPTGSQYSPVGAFTESASAYGTYDQAGNAEEWNDGVIENIARGLRGGAAIFDWTALVSTHENNYYPGNDIETSGFRIATNVPEPSTWAMLAAGAAALLALRRRRRG